MIFAIPLVGRDQAEDWDNVVARLHDTLASIDAQAISNRLIVLCGQDCPEGFPRDDRDLFLKAPPFKPVRRSGTDQSTKMKQMARAIPSIAPGFSYIMWLDADDILHPSLSEHVQRYNNGRGYLIERGWMVGPRGGVAPLDNSPGLYAHWEFCGTCAIIAVDTEAQSLPVRYMTRFAGHHHVYSRLARAHGYPLDPFPYPAVLYLFNHGSNVSTLRGRSSGKQAYMDAHSIPRNARVEVLDTFGYVLPKDRPVLAGHSEDVSASP